MRVVSNTSPLLYLHTIGQLTLLEQLYGRIIVPQAVVTELAVGAQQGYMVPRPSDYGWIQIDSVALPAMLTLIANLGAGEAEALALAIIEPTDLLILDDGLARRVAAAQRLRYTGTLGVLMQAKRVGHIPFVMPLVMQLHQAGFRLTASLIESIRRNAGE